MTTTTDHPYYRRVLAAELAARMDRNPTYSIRAFAQALDMQSSALAQILAGTRRISTRVTDRLLGKLELTSAERAEFLRSVLEEKERSGVRKINARMRSSVSEASVREVISAESSLKADVSLEQFRVIADWYHFAILEMTFKPHFRWNAPKIASALGISVTEARLAMDRLVQLELVDVQGPTPKKTDVSIDTKDKSKTSLFHRRRQRQILEKSLYSLENDPIEDRNHSGVTLCADIAQIPEAKARIQKFLWELSAFLETGSPSRVYELQVQLIPLEKNSSSRKPSPSRPT